MNDRYKLRKPDDATEIMIKQYSFGYPTPFVGRIKELGEIPTRLLNPECRLLTLTGLGRCFGTKRP